MRTAAQRKADDAKATAAALKAAERLAAALRAVGAEVTKVKATEYCDAFVAADWPGLDSQTVTISPENKRGRGWDLGYGDGVRAKWQTGSYGRRSRRVSADDTKLGVLAADIVSDWKNLAAGFASDRRLAALRRQAEAAAKEIAAPPPVRVEASSMAGELVVTLPSVSPEVAAKIVDALRPLFAAGA